MERAAVELGRINRYPDAGTTALYDALSAKFGLSPDHFAASTGSVAVLYALLNAHSRPATRSSTRGARSRPTRSPPT